MTTALRGKKLILQAQGNLDEDTDPSYLPPAREESSDGSECEDSPENESDKIQAVSVIILK